MKLDWEAMQVAGCFAVPGDHPSLPGHFPGRPVVPGVVLLDYAMALMGGELLHAKFLAPVLSDQEIEVRYQPSGAFVCLRDGLAIMSGKLA